MKNELSESYKLGYRTGFKTAIILLKRYCDDENIINKLIQDYNNYPLVDKFEAKELVNEERSK